MVGATAPLVSIAHRLHLRSTITLAPLGRFSAGAVSGSSDTGRLDRSGLLHLAFAVALDGGGGALAVTTFHERGRCNGVGIDDLGDLVAMDGLAKAGVDGRTACGDQPGGDEK